MLDIQAIKEANAAHQPFSFFQAQVLAEDALNQIRADFPALRSRAFFRWTPFNTGRASLRF